MAENDAQYACFFSIYTQVYKSLENIHVFHTFMELCTVLLCLSMN